MGYSLLEKTKIKWAHYWGYKIIKEQGAPMRASNKKNLLLIDWSESILGGDIFFTVEFFSGQLMN